jgi:DNA polymerase II large subunit
MEPERVQVMCPACGQRVEAVVSDGRVKGYCAVAKRPVNFRVEEQRIIETGAEMSKGVTPVKADRDSKGRFVRGNVPVNKRTSS